MLEQSGTSVAEALLLKVSSVEESVGTIFAPVQSGIRRDLAWVIRQVLSRGEGPAAIIAYTVREAESWQALLKEFDVPTTRVRGLADASLTAEFFESLPEEVVRQRAVVVTPQSVAGLPPRFLESFGGILVSSVALGDDPSGRLPRYRQALQLLAAGCRAVVIVSRDSLASSGYYPEPLPSWANRAAWVLHVRPPGSPPRYSTHTWHLPPEELPLREQAASLLADAGMDRSLAFGTRFRLSRTLARLMFSREIVEGTESADASEMIDEGRDAPATIQFREAVANTLLAFDDIEIEDPLLSSLEALISSRLDQRPLIVTRYRDTALAVYEHLQRGSLAADVALLTLHDNPRDIALNSLDTQSPAPDAMVITDSAMESLSQDFTGRIQIWLEADSPRIALGRARSAWGAQEVILMSEANQESDLESRIIDLLVEWHAHQSGIADLLWE